MLQPTALAETHSFEFSKDNFRNPLEKVVASVKRQRATDADGAHDASGPLLQVVDCPVTVVTSNADLEGYGYIVDDPEDFTTSKKTFEIVPWPVSGWRKLDPETGDEAGTTEGNFQVWWDGDCFRGRNLAVATSNNEYLDGVGRRDVEELAAEMRASGGPASSVRMTDEQAIYLWMSDYHPDGAQMFFPRREPGEPGDTDLSFYVCLGKREWGDDVRPENMRAFKIPSGKGVYFHPGTWHNGVYCRKPAAGGKAQRMFFTRQGRVHARVSACWATEFGKLVRVPLCEE